MEVLIQLNKNIWEYVGNFLGILSIASLAGGIGSVGIIGLENIYCGLLSWWTSGNYIFYTLFQIIGAIGFLMLFITKTRSQGILLLVAIVMMYLIPVEFHYYHCVQKTPTEQTQDGIGGVNPSSLDNMAVK